MLQSGRNKGKPTKPNREEQYIVTSEQAGDDWCACLRRITRITIFPLEVCLLIIIGLPSVHRIKHKSVFEVCEQKRVSSVKS